ncbi:hypothetical protein [Amycolatopsis benzoatilytica]|uniref:hypothetical protein n=1 Tax=Amycolatopsis benzoatilytica TaxID=346045 RepID=UPI00039AF5BF|nr:hypothetical protein [Amycolatopsis benzoatilytica]
MLSLGRCNPDEVRTRAVKALDGIRNVFEDRAGRGEPSAAAKLDQVREVILDFGQLENKLQPIEVIEKIDAIVEPVTDREEPAQDMCGEPLPSDDTARCQNPTGHTGPHWTHGCGHGSTSWRASEEPAGETNSQRTPSSPQTGSPAPRTLLGWTVPDHIEIAGAGELIELWCTYHKLSVSGGWTNRESAAPIQYFLRNHAHGQPVERQAQEADRG